MQHAEQTAPTHAPSAPGFTRDTQRSRLRVHPLLEALARVWFAYARDQHGLRRRRPAARFLARNARFLAAAWRRPLVEAQMSGLSVLLPTSDRTIARSVFASGDWDPLLVGTAFAALRDFGVDVRGTTFLEIGANFGVYALPAVAEHGFARAVAYEPDPAAFELLQTNIRRNGLEGRIDAFQAALSDRSGWLELSRSQSNRGDNRIVGAGPVHNGARDVVAVRAATFDQEVDAGRIPLSELGLVWLDVQGHEADMLAGAGRLLAAGVPLVLEYSSSMLEPAARRSLDELLGAHYDVVVDLGWAALTDRIRFQPASAIASLVPEGRPIETDLLLLRNLWRAPSTGRGLG